MVIWSVAIWAIMEWVGFKNMAHDLWWSLGAAAMLLIGLIGNVWIFFLITKEETWKWVKDQSSG